MRGFNVSDHTLETSLQCIEHVLLIADDYKGKAFGSFLRNVIVPRITSPPADVSLDTVDLWFTTEKKAIKFIKHMKFNSPSDYTFTEVSPRMIEKYVCASEVSPNVIEKYGHSAKKYNLNMCGNNIAWFYIIVSEDFPANDFDVNCLTYTCRKDYSTGRKIVTKELKGERGCQREELIRAILQKQIRMFKSYAEKIIKDKDYLGKVNRLIDKGWTVTFGEHKMTKPVSQNELPFLLVALESNMKSVNSQTSAVCELTIEEQEAKAHDDIKVTSLEDIIRNNPLVKDAIARIITKMICESATVIESKK